MSYKPSIISPIDISGLAKKDGVIAFAKDIVSREDGIGAEFIRRRSAGQLHIGDGSAFMRSIKGKSLVWNQMVENGNFADGDTGWGADNYSLSVTNGVLKATVITPDGSASIAANVLGSIKGHKYYTGATIKYTDNAPSDNLFIGSGGHDGIRIPKTISFSSFVKCSGIFTRGEGGYDDFRIYPRITTPGGYIEIMNAMCIDLTQMFGAGNEPSTAAEFEALFPLPYYPYNAGEIVNLKATKLLTNGFNQWDGTKARVLANNDYYIAGAYTAVKFSETLDGEQTDVAINNRIFHIANNGFVFVTGADGTTCINFSNASLNGTYKPYEQHELTLPAGLTKTYTGADGQTHTWQGLDSAGSAYDEQTPTKNIQRIGVVDLGALDLGRQDSGEVHGFRGTLQNMKRPANSEVPNFLVKGYSPVPYNAVWGNKNVTIDDSANIVFLDNAYDTAAEFKAAMAGVLLFYELAEPIETEVPARNFNYFISDMGQEWILPEGVDEQGVPMTASFNAVIAYASNVRDTIFHLPENYLSKESTIALLEAMKSANLIASYTMTFDTANNKYSFTITKAS